MYQAIVPASTHTKTLSDGLIGPTRSLIEAFAKSANALPVELAQMIGPKVLAAFVQSLGVKSELRPDTTLALGSREMTLAELVGAYAVIFRGGIPIEPYTHLGLVHDGIVRMRLPAPGERRIDAGTLVAIRGLM